MVNQEIEFFKTVSRSLLPIKSRHPYYIVAARYVRTSAGIRALHLLCHWLNRVGYSAFMLIYPDFQYKNQTDPYLSTPVLTEAIIEAHHEAGLTPIVIYPEVTNGNPFDATAKVVFLGHFPGKLGGPASYDETHLLFSYSQSIAKTTSQPENILYVPVIDTTVFYDRKLGLRDNTCFYASKFKTVFGGVVQGVPENCIEITRDKPDSQTANEIADLFCRSRAFYCFEDSALVLEALMCNCPVIFMPSEFFKHPIGIDEIGWDGIAWGCDTVEIERAINTVENGKQNYFNQIENFFDQLKNFVQKTQLHALENPQHTPIDVPHLTDAFSSKYLVTDENLVKLGQLLLGNSKELVNLQQGEELLWCPEIDIYKAKCLIDLGYGWRDNRGEEIWSSGPFSVIELNYIDQYDNISLCFQSFCGPELSREYIFFANDNEIARASIPVWEHYIIRIPRSQIVFKINSEVVTLRITHASVGSPSQLWGGPDMRQIGIRLTRVAATTSMND